MIDSWYLYLYPLDLYCMYCFIIPELKETIVFNILSYDYLLLKKVRWVFTFVFPYYPSLKLLLNR